MQFKRFRLLLFPFALIYQVIAGIRNWLYDNNFLKSFKLDLKTISVGNLTVGGAGKTPLVEYLINLLKSDYQIVTLSRGYKRKTKGFILAGSKDSARTIGDEPAQFLKKFGKEIGVAVCEDRLFAIPHILDSRPETNLIILDDAFQHRRIYPTFNILISDFNHPFYCDWILPSGDLRESRKNANRADLIIITKCPNDITIDNIESIKSNVRKYVRDEMPVFFMNIQYHPPVSVYGKDIEISDNIILVTGIAQPNQLVDWIQTKYHMIKHFNFPDHHTFSKNDWNKIIGYYHKNSAIDVSILLTEKDTMRISNIKIQDILRSYPVFFQPITYKFAQNGSDFDKIIQKVLVNS